VVVGNCKSPDSISSVFAESYAQLYSSVHSEDEELSQLGDRTQNKLKSSNERFIVTRDDVTKAVHQMKAGKRESILNAPDSLHVHLSLLLSAMFTHGFVIDELTVSTTVPIPKPKLNACNSSKYRSIALGSIIGKLIDLVLLQKLAHKLLACDLQFGFKKGHSTSMCTQFLKETVAYYTSNDSSVYCIMLDASKAFDRVRYAKLFLKMLNRDISSTVIRLLMTLYSNQFYNVKWNQNTSAPFPVQPYAILCLSRRTVTASENGESRLLRW
jgi:Reverse transcriptase (RNA-dependent DNA polymerase)